MTEDQNTIANNVQTESIVKKILTSEVKYILGIVIFLVGVVAPYYDIKTEIALIKQNHLAHIETMRKEISENTIDIKELRTTMVELMGKISEQNAQILLLGK